MPDVSIALIKESNKRFSTSGRTPLTTRSSRLSKEAINAMMKRAYERLSR